MDAEVSAQIGAQHGERSPERVTHRNGYRSRDWTLGWVRWSCASPSSGRGAISLARGGLEPRRRSEKALLAVIQQAYVEGVSTRRVDDLVKSLGCDGISKSQVSRICRDLDQVVENFLGRPLDGGPYPYVWLDALTQKVREGGRPPQADERQRGGGHRRDRCRSARDPGHGRGRQRGRRVLAVLPALPERSGPQRSGTGHLRCSPWAEAGYRHGVCRRRLVRLRRTAPTS